MGGGPAPPAMSLAGVSATAVDDEAMASKSASLRSGAMRQRDVGPEQATTAELGDLSAGRRRRAGMGMDPLPVVLVPEPSAPRSRRVLIRRCRRKRRRAWCQPMA